MKTATTFPAPSELLPHRSLMLLVDRIIDYTPGISLIGYKHIAEDNPFFDGHFPGYPIMPGVILLEMIYQTGGLFVRMEPNNKPGAEGKRRLGKALKVKNANFREEVRPGDELFIHVRLKQKMFGFYQFIGEIFCEDILVTDAEVTIFVGE